ncbi:hypothetical protein PN498_03075 [Oscillatoria sp. CS-180]|nr:hypothetical protein [Oscillatoria sp. CS-180]MDB9524958.1 hypothetical protein [Oscillatoria sp. CS-180]
MAKDTDMEDKTLQWKRKRSYSESVQTGEDAMALVSFSTIVT